MACDLVVTCPRVWGQPTDERDEWRKQRDAEGGERDMGREQWSPTVAHALQQIRDHLILLVRLRRFWSRLTRGLLQCLAKNPGDLVNVGLLKYGQVATGCRVFPKIAGQHCAPAVVYVGVKKGAIDLDQQRRTAKRPGFVGKINSVVDIRCQANARWRWISSLLVVSQVLCISLVDNVAGELVSPTIDLGLYELNLPFERSLTKHSRVTSQPFLRSRKSPANVATRIQKDQQPDFLIQFLESMSHRERDSAAH